MNEPKRNSDSPLLVRPFSEVRASMPPGDGPPCPSCGAAQVQGQDGYICRVCAGKEAPSRG
jgi:hypothetical protein